MHEPSQITVGPFCLFGGDTNVMTSDMHAILDVETGLRINPAEDVLIESNVWIGARGHPEGMPYRGRLNHRSGRGGYRRCPAPGGGGGEPGAYRANRRDLARRSACTMTQGAR